jgi:hypothetical protein
MGKEQFKILPNSLVRRVNLILAVYFQIPKSLSNSRSRNTGLNTAARANKVMLPIVISSLSTLVHYMSICRRHVYIHMVCVYVYHKPNSSWSCRAASPTGWDFTVATESILHRPLPVPLSRCSSRAWPGWILWAWRSRKTLRREMAIFQSLQ